MRNRKLLSAIVVVVMALGSFSTAFGASGTTFADMPDNWSTSALQAAADNGLLKGYSQAGKTLIQPDNALTRAEMATVINRAFGASEKGSISSVKDIAASDWFASEMAKAVGMETFAVADNMRPNDKITRQEAFAVLSRAFGTASTDTTYAALKKFSDGSSVSAWAKADVSGLVEAGYVNGSAGKLNPLANITRAEFAVIMDNLVAQYIDAAGTVTTVADGNVLVRVPGVTLQNITVKGDLIIGDGVGVGDVNLVGVKVQGDMIVRGGGENSIKIKAGTEITGKVFIKKTSDGKVRIFNEAGEDISVEVEDGSEDVVLEGTFSDVVIQSDSVTVQAKNATIASAEIQGAGAKLVVESGSTVTKVTVSASNVSVSGTGTVATVTVAAGGNNAAVNTPNTKTTVETGASGVTAGGTAVAAGQTATNNASGTGATVTTGTTTGGGGGGGSSDDLYVTINGTDVNIDSLSAEYLSRADLVGVVGYLADAAFGATSAAGTVTNIDITGAGVGVFAPLADQASYANIKTMLTTIATNAVAAGQTGPENVSDAWDTANAITGFSYTADGTVNVVQSVTISGIPGLAGNSYILWTNASGETTEANFQIVYDALKNDSLVSLDGLTLTIVTDQGTKTVVLDYK